MDRAGDDRERAATIYRHEATGAEQVITSAIDAHILAEAKRGDDQDGRCAGHSWLMDRRVADGPDWCGRALERVP